MRIVSQCLRVFRASFTLVAVAWRAVTSTGLT